MKKKSMLVLVLLFLNFGLTSAEVNKKDSDTFELNPYSAGAISEENKKFIQDVIANFKGQDKISIFKSSAFAQENFPVYRQVAVNAQQKAIYLNEEYFNKLDVQEKIATIGWSLLFIEEFKSNQSKNFRLAIGLTSANMAFGIFAWVALSKYLAKNHSDYNNWKYKLPAVYIATSISALTILSKLQKFFENKFVLDFDNKLISRLDCRDGLIKFLKRQQKFHETLNEQETKEYKQLKLRINNLEIKNKN